ncbi:MAG: DNA-3-methyladenine glycosylase family protein [Blastocatellia bacterium]
MRNPPPRKNAEPQYSILSANELATATHELATRDARLGVIVQRLGVPPLWDRQPGFPTLVHVILEQQVSLASARAAFRRLGESIHPVNPQNFLTLDDATLKEIGFSRQKTLYCRLLAQALHDKQLSLRALEKMSDDNVRATLTSLKGIGTWTADCYLLMALLRPDIWPVGDLALVIAVQRALSLEKRPAAIEMETLAEPWRPWRSVAARILWHHYLNPLEKG